MSANQVGAAIAAASLLIALPSIANEIKTVDVQIPQDNIFTTEKVLPLNDNHRRRFYARISIESNTLKMIHVTKFINDFAMPLREFTHEVTAIKTCDFDGFDISNCVIQKGDIFVLPEGKKASDYSFQIAYSESGLRSNAKFAIDDAVLSEAKAPVESSDLPKNLKK